MDLKPTFQDSMIEALAEQIRQGAIEQARLVALLRDKDRELEALLRARIEDQRAMQPFISLGHEVMEARGDRDAIYSAVFKFVDSVQEVSA